MCITGTVLLKKISDQWNYFYTEILPMLQAMLYPLPVSLICIILCKIHLLRHRKEGK